MRNESHKTFIGTMRDHVIAWRKREGWSRESVVHAIVSAHAEIDGPATTGIVFDPTTRDAFERQKVNADRVFRWLDDESKDNNLLPANFIPSIWAAMPMDIRLHCVADCLAPVGISVSSTEHDLGEEFDPTRHVSEMIKETSEAQLALINVKPGASIAALEIARKELADVQETTTRASRAVDKALVRMRAATAVVRKIARRAA
jgi:hypothetical protein